MDNEDAKINWSLWLLSGLLLVLLAGGTYFWNGNKNLTRRNDQAERRADSLLSVRLQLEADMKQVGDQLAAAKDANTELRKQVQESDRRLAQTDTRLRELRQGNARRGQTIRDLNQSMGNLTSQRDSLANQMTAMRDKIGWLSDSNTVYQERTSQLRGQMAGLRANLDEAMATMVPRTLLTADGFRVEAVKPNGKETAKAKKVATLSLSLNLPAELGLSGQQDVYLSLTDETRNAVLPPLRNETINLPTLNETIPVHAVQSVAWGQEPQRITFQLAPDTRLKPGLYRAAVYTKHRYLGAVEFRFRDSFWFF